MTSSKVKRGERFGLLTAVRPVEGKQGTRKWKFTCDCGGECVRDIYSLQRVRKSSCGCARSEINKECHRPMVKHGMCRTKPYIAWRNAGQTAEGVCREWREFNDFWRDMKGEYREGLSLKRLDATKEWSKDNCVWMERKQRLPSKVALIVETPAGKMHRNEAARYYGMDPSTMQSRMKANWPISLMCEVPLLPKGVSLRDYIKKSAGSKQNQNEGAGDERRQRPCEHSLPVL